MALVSPESVWFYDKVWNILFCFFLLVWLDMRTSITVNKLLANIPDNDKDVLRVSQLSPSFDSDMEWVLICLYDCGANNVPSQSCASLFNPPSCTYALLPQSWFSPRFVSKIGKRRSVEACWMPKSTTESSPCCCVMVCRLQWSWELF